MKEADNVVKLDNVSAIIGTFPVLSELTITIKQGERIVLIGPSGSGKTSLIRLIAGLIRTNSGTLSLFDNLVSSQNDWMAARRRSAMIFQDFNLYEMKSILDNVTFTHSQLTGSNPASHADQALALLDLVGCRELAERYPFQISGGQKQRVAIARALMSQPELLLLDEPTASLDPESVQGVLRLLVDVAERRTLKGPVTVVCATHEMNFARRLADRIIFMKQGRIIEIGPPDQMLDRPQSPDLEKFLSSVRS